MVDGKIVSGNSGGTVLNNSMKVVGIAVTGTDRMENADETHHHGVIPITALKYLDVR